MLLRDLSYLLPWQFSPTELTVCVLTLALYIRGLTRLKRSGTPIGFWRPFVFFLGVALNYAVMQTYFDFLSQHMFWVHRLQHLILHHIGPVLIVLSGPAPVLRAALPRTRRLLARLHGALTPLRLLWRTLQHPVIAPALFVGLIWFWLVPSIHFTAMLDTRRYLLMNWSMLADGLCFWWLMLAPLEQQGETAIRYGLRVIILTVVAIGQIVIGAYITLVPWSLYSIYAVCGRAFAINPMVDQQIGGLLTWIPGAMMSTLGVLVVLHHVLAEERRRSARSCLAPTNPASSRPSAGLPA